MLSLSEVLSLIGLILIICELFIGIQTGFDLVLVGSCLIVGGFSGILSHNPTLALIISILLSLLYIIFGRNFIKRRFISLSKHTNIDKLIGQTGTVIRSITPTPPPVSSVWTMKTGAPPRMISSTRKTGVLFSLSTASP